LSRTRLIPPQPPRRPPRVRIAGSSWTCLPFCEVLVISNTSASSGRSNPCGILIDAGGHGVGAAAVCYCVRAAAFATAASISAKSSRTGETSRMSPSSRWPFSPSISERISADCVLGASKRLVGRAPRPTVSGQPLRVQVAVDRDHARSNPGASKRSKLRLAWSGGRDPVGLLFHHPPHTRWWRHMPPVLLLDSAFGRSDAYARKSDIFTAEGSGRRYASLVEAFACFSRNCRNRRHLNHVLVGVSGRHARLLSRRRAADDNGRRGLLYRFGREVAVARLIGRARGWLTGPGSTGQVIDLYFLRPVQPVATGGNSKPYRWCSGYEQHRRLCRGRRAIAQLVERGGGPFWPSLPDGERSPG